MWCFQCGAEYQEGVETCAECGVGLVTEAPLAPEDVGSSDEEQLAYELHDWSFESRRMLDQLLTGAGLAHSWQGATMIVRVDDEDAIDDLVGRKWLRGHEAHSAFVARLDALLVLGAALKTPQRTHPCILP